jgi:hypothetical protein
MADEIVFTTNKPRRHVVRWSNGPLDSPNSVRVYRESPESVMLQFRMTKEYAGVSLSFDEAREIAARLAQASDEGIEAQHRAAVKTMYRSIR